MRLQAHPAERRKLLSSRFAPLLKAVHRKSPRVDGGYQGDEAQRAAFEASRISITVVKRTGKKVKGSIVLPKRWVSNERSAESIARAVCQKTSRRP